MFGCSIGWMLWCGQSAVFYEECDFGTLCSIKWLLLINYDGDKLCWWNLRWNWRQLWWCVHVLKICWWLLTTCCWTYSLIESYVHAFMLLVSDCIFILATTGFYIHIGDYEYLVFILAVTMIWMYLRWRPWGDKYHIHIEVVFRRIA